MRSHPSATINGRVAYKISKTLKVELEGFNLANRRDSAIDYLYASRLKNELAAVDDIHFHPLESRSLRLTVMKNWCAHTGGAKMLRYRDDQSRTSFYRSGPAGA